MNRKELIEIAKRCGAGSCHYPCQFRVRDWQSKEEYMTCMEDLIKALAGELEKATLVITVKKKGTKNEK